MEHLRLPRAGGEPPNMKETVMPPTLTLFLGNSKQKNLSCFLFNRVLIFVKKLSRGNQPRRLVPSKGQKAEMRGIQTRRWRTKKRPKAEIVESTEALEDKKAAKTNIVESKEALEDKKAPKS